MPTKKTRTILTMPTPESLEFLRQRAKEAGLSLNNYILQKLEIETLKHGGKREQIKTDQQTERRTQERYGA